MENLQDPVIVKERIDRNLEELGNLSSEDRSRSRKEIMDELSRDLSEYYGYLPELIELFLDLFSPAEGVQYIEASERPRPLVIRTNTLKTTRKELMENLTKRGANVEAVEWSKVAIKVTESSVPIGATPEYLAGHYMLQAASSLNPVMALAPEPGEKVLDMSSAPGGKTSYIAQLMKNAGFLLANDLKPMRQKATIANLHRLGVKNAVVCCHDGRKIGQTMKGFDRVLLDAPCSGMGIISRDPSVKLQRTVKDIERMAHLQKELLRTAIDVVNVNGVVVYSTCSITVEENEMVVDYILKKRHVKIVETGLQVGRAGLTRYKERRFHPSVANTRRFYPHVHNMDGFYVAKIIKLAHGERQDDDEDEVSSNNDEDSNGIDDSEDESMSVDDEESTEEIAVKSSKKPTVPVQQTKNATNGKQATNHSSTNNLKKRRVESNGESEEEDEKLHAVSKNKDAKQSVVTKPVTKGAKEAVVEVPTEVSSAKKKARIDGQESKVNQIPTTASTPPRDFEESKDKLLKRSDNAIAVAATPVAAEQETITKSSKKTGKKPLTASDDSNDEVDEDDEDAAAFSRVSVSPSRLMTPGSDKRPKTIRQLRQLSATKKKLNV
jgi:ribosomal RNA methyltransferase Nop2